VCAHATPPDEVEALLRACVGHELAVEVIRLDRDRGHIFVSEQLRSERQLALALLAYTLLVRAEPARNQLSEDPEVLAQLR